MGNVLGWSKWEQRRKEEERRKWKEFWVKERKGEEYFGSGGGGELGHGGKRWESRFLLWMRTNHGRMEGMRYKREEERCGCGGKEDRDHMLLYCKMWEEERREVWKGWWCGWLSGEGWIEMDRMLFGEEGVRRMLEFAVKIGWEKRKWGKWRGRGSEDRVGNIMRSRVEGGGGWLAERSERRRREIKEGAGLRAKRWRERESVEEKRVRLVRDKKRKRDIKLGLRVVKRRKVGDSMEGVSERDRAVGRNLGRGGRSVLGDLVNMGEGKKGEIVLKTASDLDSAVSPIASGTLDENGLLFTEE